MNSNTAPAYASAQNGNWLSDLSLLGWITFTWPFTGLYKAVVNHTDVWSIRKQVTNISVVGIILYVATALLIYFHLYWWIILATVLYIFATLVRGLVQVAQDDGDDHEDYAGG